SFSKPSQPTFCVSNRRFKLAPASSLPIAPSNSVAALRAVRLRATLAAPPGIEFSRSNSTTGTGASGEIRATRPQMNWSSMTSPTTSTRVWLAPANNFLTRCNDRDSILGYEIEHSVEKRGEWARGAGGFLRRGQANLIGQPACFNRLLKRNRHPVRIVRHGDGSIDEHRGGSHLHGFGGVARSAQSRVHDYGHNGLFDDDANLI